MRATEKYRKAEQLSVEKSFTMPKPRTNENLYEMLESKGYRWVSKAREWLPDSETPSTTIFADKKGKATGIARLRLMCHPDEVSFFLNQLETMANVEVIEVSEKTYPNRHGAGERAYITIRRTD
jgi:hypothetical protein